MSTNHFNELLAVNVDHFVETKGRFKYLSWSHALAEVIKRDPLANWEFHEPTVFHDGTMLVWCSFTAFGKTIRMHLPVMNNQNRAVQNPSARDINDNMMRCLVKAIAAHGLGLGLYSKDGIPADVEEPFDEEVQATNREALVAELQEAAKQGSDSLKAKHQALAKSNKGKLLIEVWNEIGERLKNQADAVTTKGVN